MPCERPRACLIAGGRIPALVAIAALTALAAAGGCSEKTSRPHPSNRCAPQAAFDARLDPVAASFVLVRVPGTQPGRTSADVELVGSNLGSDPATGTVSLDVGIRNVSRFALPAPAQVWLDAFVPAGIEVSNADFTDPSRQGFDYSSLGGADGVLSPGETSQTKSWQFRVPGLVSFTFAAVATFGVRIIPLEDPRSVVLTDRPPDEIRQDPYRLAAVDLAGDIITLRVGFSGCTPGQDFPLFLSGGFMESNPVQARLVLGHDDHGELCDAAFERTLRFDLTPVREAYERAYGRPGPVRLILTDLEGNRHELFYRPGLPSGVNLLPNGSFERDGLPIRPGRPATGDAGSVVVRIAQAERNSV